jgi:Tfp pilus assembly protein PilV
MIREARSASPQALRPRLLALSSRGYILLELIIALSIFSIGVLGLARTLNASMEVANILNKEQRLRIGLRSFVEEIRRKPMAEMATTITDPVLEVTYTSTLEPVSLIMTRGGTLADMYNLKVIASYTVGAELREETVDVYVYKPAQK